jgi:hypothetical protein
MANGIVLPAGFSFRRQHRVYSQGTKTFWRGKDRSSARASVRNAS